MEFETNKWNLNESEENAVERKKIEENRIRMEEKAEKTNWNEENRKNGIKIEKIEKEKKQN